MDRFLLYAIVDKYSLDNFVHVWKMRAVNVGCKKYIDSKIANSERGFWNYICKYVKLSTGFMQRYDHFLNFALISHQELTLDFILEYRYMLDMNVIYKNYKFNDRLLSSIITEDNPYCFAYWYELCMYQELSEEFLYKYINHLYWKVIAVYQKLSEDFIDKNIHEFRTYSMKHICKHQKLSEKFIEKYSDIIDFYNISFSQDLSIEFIDKYSDKLNWNMLKPKLQKMNIPPWFSQKYQTNEGVGMRGEGDEGKLNMVLISNPHPHPRWILPLLS